MGNGLYPAIRHQSPQGFTNRRSAELQLLADGRFTHITTSRVLPVEDPFPDDLIDAVGSSH
ncbi:hypothetical protein Q427_18370 [Halomonas sp. BC04]|nr:hypothetical protein Q427_18370 [Halomonas sp. BC04]